MRNRSPIALIASLFTGLLLLPLSLLAQPLTVGAKAPDFSLSTQEGKPFNLSSRAGQGWTVLYFYPKAGTPGCTTQACAFRDAIQQIRTLKAEVYGISTDDVSALAKFHREHGLKFTLLSDPDAHTTEAYGVKMPVVNMAKRWTFIVDPDLVIQDINDDVDPALDAKVVAERIQKLQSTH